MSARDSWTAILHSPAVKVLGTVIAVSFGAGGAVFAWNARQVSADDVRAIVNVNDHGTVEQLAEQRRPYLDGMTATLRKHSDEIAALQAAQQGATARQDTLLKLLLHSYRWRVRSQAAEYEPDARKRKLAADNAEDRFDRLLAGGADPDEALRRVLETDPRLLR